MSAGPFRALRHANYRLYFAGMVVSQTGSWMQGTALGWLVYHLTGSPELLGLATLANTGTMCLLSPFGGVLADRIARVQIIFWCQLLLALCCGLLAVLTLGGWVQVTHILIISVCFGGINAFEITARMAFALDLVGREDLSNAVSLNSVAFNGSRVIGPAMAGLMIAGWGPGSCFVANTLSFLVVMAALGAMRFPPAAPKAAPTGPRAGLWRELGEGFGEVLRPGPIRTIITVVGCSGVLAMPLMTLTPVFARDVFHGGPEVQGSLMALMGVGASAAALALAARTSLHRLPRLMVWSALGFAVTTIGYCWSGSLGLALAVIILPGFFIVSLNVGGNNLVQYLAPEGKRGRVLAFYSMVFNATFAIGAGVGGLLTGLLGAQWAMSLLALALAVVVPTILRGFVLPQEKPIAVSVAVAALAPASRLAAD